MRIMAIKGPLVYVEKHTHVCIRGIQLNHMPGKIFLQAKRF